jgi:hypothetical protein
MADRVAAMMPTLTGLTYDLAWPSQMPILSQFTGTTPAGNRSRTSLEVVVNDPRSDAKLLVRDYIRSNLSNNGSAGAFDRKPRSKLRFEADLETAVEHATAGSERSPVLDTALSRAAHRRRAEGSRIRRRRRRW